MYILRGLRERLKDDHEDIGTCRCRNTSERILHKTNIAISVDDMLQNNADAHKLSCFELIRRSYKEKLLQHMFIPHKTDLSAKTTNSRVDVTTIQ